MPQLVLEYIEENQLMGPHQLITVDNTLYALYGPHLELQAARIWDHLQTLWQLELTRGSAFSQPYARSPRATEEEEEA